MQELEELELIHKIKNGETSLFETLITENQNKLFSFIKRIVKNDEDTMDICQETFLKAYKGITSFKAKSKFSTWLYQIGYNTAISHIKKSKNKDKYEQKYFNNSEEINEIELHEKNSTNEIIKKIINGLDKKYQTVLYLFYFNDESYEVISDIMKIPLNTVKSYIFRAKNLIRKKLTEEYNFEFVDAESGPNIQLLKEIKNAN
jgi:RNA polymerase sigma factor (sigma-70 family)